jgi:RNA polymerase sigma-70 factor, ECF subfamily
VTASIEDQQLVESYRAGDPEGFARLVRVYQPALMGHALRRLHDRAAAEDAVQETFVRAYRALPRFNGEYKLGPWLHRILANVCIDEANRRRREYEKLDRVATRADAVAPVPGVDEQLGFAYDDSPLQEALRHLPPSYLEALSLRFVDELSYPEVAAAAGVSEQNARARVSRARTAMRVALQGVAVLPVFLMGLLRRGERAAAALPGDAVRVGASTATNAGSSGAASVSTAAASTAAQVGPVAAAFAPAVEAANTVVVAAPQAMPLLTKAAIGLGMAAAVAVPTAGPAVVGRTQPATVSSTTQVMIAPTSAPVVTVAPSSAAAGPGAGAATAGATGPNLVAPATTAALAEGPTTMPTGGTAPATAPTTVAPSAPTTATPTTATLTAAPPTTVATSRAPTTTAPSSSAAPPTVTTLPAPSSTLPAPAGGSLQASGLQVTPAGPRVDVDGPFTLTVAGQAHTGRLTGRLAVAEPDASGRQRVDGTLTLSLSAGGSMEIRLAGQGTAADADAPGTSPRVVTLAGPFRAAGNPVGLVAAGSATGSLDLAGGSLSLSLTG